MTDEQRAALFEAADEADSFLRETDATADRNDATRVHLRNLLHAISETTAWTQSEA